MMPKLSVALLAGAAVVIAGLSAQPLLADVRVKPVRDPVVEKECGACHMVYPAGLLPARSWAAMMSDLKNHFGDNAELDPGTARRIADYLVANAAESVFDRHHGRDHHHRRRADDTGAGAAPLRISELPWFKREHERRERIAPATLKKRGAKSVSDCKACHEGAEQGWFED